MSADYDGSIKLGISVSADTKSVEAELGALRNQLSSMFSSVDKSLASGSGSFVNIEKIITQIAGDVSLISKAISQIPQSKLAKVVSSVQQAGSSAKSGANDIQQASSNAAHSFDLESASAEQLYAELKRLKSAAADLMASKKLQGYTTAQAFNSRDARVIRAQKTAVENQLTSRQLSPDKEYQPALNIDTGNGEDKLHTLENSIKLVEEALKEVNADLSAMDANDGGFAEKTARVQELTTMLERMNAELDKETINVFGMGDESTPAQSSSSATSGSARYEDPSSGVNKYMEIATTQGKQAAEAFRQQYDEICIKQGSAAGAEFAKNFATSASEAAKSSVISGLRKELNDLQTTIKQFNSGKITLSDEDLAKTLNKAEQLKTKIANITTTARQVDADIPIDNGLRNALLQANELQAKLKEFQSTGVGFGSMEEAKEATARLRSLQQAITDYKTELNAVPPVDIPVAQGELGKAIEEYSQLNSEVKKFKSTGVGMSDEDFASAIARLEELKQKINDMQSALSNPKAGGMSSVITKIGNIGSAIGSVTRAANGMMGKVGGVLKAVTAKIKSVIGWFKKLRGQSNDTTADITKGFKKALTMFAKIALGARGLFIIFRRLRTAVISAFQEMAKQVPSVNSTLSSFVTALNQVKGSLATAFQPIVSVVFPILTKLLGALNTAMNAIGQFFAVLTGQNKIYKYTANQVDYAQSLQDTADSADKAADSAKKAQKSLMGFDELNRLDAPQEDTSSASGAGAGAGGGVYEEVAVDPNDAVSKFAQMLKDAWSKADFFDVGQYIGTNLRDGLNSVNDWITTKGYPLAEKIGKSFGTLINGIVAVPGLAVSIGRTVADAINMGMMGLDKFLTTTNWYDVGKFISDAITSFIVSIKWELFGKLVADYLLAGINTWWSFIQNFDFSQLGQKIADAINSFFKTMGDVDIESGLSGWQKLGQAISGSVTGILEMIITALNGVNWEEVGVAIGELISSIDWAKVAIDFGRLVLAIVTGIGRAFAGWAATDPISAGICAMLLVAFGGIKTAVLIQGLTAALSPIFAFLGNLGIGELISGAFGSIASVVSQAGGAIVSFGASLSSVFSLVSSGTATLHGAMTTVFGGVATAISGIVAVAGGAILAVTNFFSMLTGGFSWVKEILMVVGIAIVALGATILGVPGIIAAAVAAAVAVLATIVVVVHDNWDAICEFCGERLDAIKELIGTFVEGAKEVLNIWFEWIKAGFTVVCNIVSVIIQGIALVITTIISAVVLTVTTAAAIIAGIVETVCTVVYNIISGILQTISSIISTALDVISTCISVVANIIHAIVTGNISSIKTFVLEGIATLVSKITTGLNNIRQIWTSVFNTIASTTKSIWTGIVSFIRGTVNTIIGVINSMIRGIVSGINAAINAINSINVTIPSWVPGIGGSSIGFHLSQISAPQIPMLAQGAVIPSNKPFLAMLGDQSNGTNVEAPLSTIEEAVANVMNEQLDAMAAMAEAIVGAIENKNMEVVIGDKDIGQANDRYTRRQSLVRGTI